MCGINGIAYPKSINRMVSPETLVLMRDELTHRGPDDSGIFVSHNIGFGHRRLSIIDVSRGHQPMSTSDGRLTITYNGEIFNHKEIREQLTTKGYRFETESDTETILHAFREFGADCLQYFRGMFAFAIWDEQTGVLFLARDRFGIKPLFYLKSDDGSLFFASEIKALLKPGLSKPELDYSSLSQRVAGYGVPGEHTMFRGIKKLLPGHYLLWRDGAIQFHEYWRLAYEPKIAFNNNSAAIDEWRSLFYHSVELRLLSDVPLGLFLSGGIDSSAICAAMADKVGAGIKTFSVGFRESHANELQFARLVAAKFHTDHNEILIDAQDCLAHLPQLVWHMDEPIGFEASVPLYFVSKLAADHVKVVLTGEGCDETLGGYSRYKHTQALLSLGRVYESVTSSSLRSRIKRSIKVLPESLQKIAERTFLSRAANLDEMYIDNFSVFPAELRSRLFSKPTHDQINDENFSHTGNVHSPASGHGNLLDSLLSYDLETYLRDLLDKQDKMSMAASIESRVPFLDHHLMEFSARLPEHFKICRNTSKWVLRQSMKGILPDEILYRKKMGFPVPYKDWFRKEWREAINEYVVSPRSLERQVFNPDYVIDLVRRHMNGEDHTSKLWFLLNFEIWQRIYFDGDFPQANFAVKLN
jgi:asparagine synthase (glutamine-hydrolysing)